MGIWNFIKICLSDPKFWFFLSLLVLILFVFRKPPFPYLDIRKIVSNYSDVFSNRKSDICFFTIFPLFFSIGTQLAKPITSDGTDVICVVLSILTTMVLTFMTISSSEASLSASKNVKDYGDLRKEYYNKDAIAVGMFEVLISVFVLLLTFALPAIESLNRLAWIVSFLIYFGFYVFVLNIFIMLRRLYQIYFPTK